MRPPTHTDPHAIPRNGTDVPWVEAGPREESPDPAEEPRDEETGAAAGTATPT